MATKFLLALSLSLLVSAAFGDRMRPSYLTRQQQCRIERLGACQPNQRIESEGGRMELWDERQDQFQCAGVVPMRNVLRRNGLSLPNYHPSPRLVYIERGQGFIGITFPGCAETYGTHRSQFTGTGERIYETEGQDRGNARNLHQKVHRIRRGDIIAIPAGAAHWCYNDGNEDLVAVSINDVNHLSNQLDERFRAFYLAGAVPQGSIQGQSQSRYQFQNVFRGFDTNLLAEAFNVDPDMARRLQDADEAGSSRGLSVIAREPMRFREFEEQEEYMRRGSRGQYEPDNGIEETFCTMKLTHNLENRKEADIYSRNAGHLNVVDRHKLPILQHMDMSAEKGNLLPNALLSPDWSVQGHTVVYVTRGEAQIQVVNHNGQSLMNDRVNRGDMFVMPQYYTSTARAGNEGFEWVAFKTTGWPMRNPVAGYTSVIRAMPLQVLTNAYQVSPDQAQSLKMNRGAQSFLLTPGQSPRRS